MREVHLWVIACRRCAHITQQDSRAWTARVIEGDHDIEGDMNYHLGERLKLEEWRRGERDGENITERERWVLLK